MKKLLQIFTVLFFAVVISVPVFATNGMRMIGFGPVQRAMGGASVGVALDAASLLSNPAGMSDLGGRIDFGASYFQPIVEYSATGVSSGVTYDSTKGASPIPAMGLIIPINDSISFGIGAYGVSGMGVDYPVSLMGNIVNSSYSQMRFAPGLSFKINDAISIGVVANVMYATMGFYAGGGATPHMSSAAFGLGATIGILIKPIDMLKIGLAYETNSVFGAFEFSVATLTEKIEFNQPQSATIGFAILPLEALTIAFDIQWIRWSETNGQSKPGYIAVANPQASWNLDWSNQLVFKFGIQLAVSSAITVRAGYNYGKMPLESNRAFENIAFPAVAEHHITLGLGLKFSDHFSLNIGGMYAPEATITGANPLYGITSYETSMSQYSIDLGLAYTFQNCI